MTEFKRKRVVVTGVGAITPIGNTPERYWSGLASGRNGIGEITLFDASHHDCRIAGEVNRFRPTRVHGSKRSQAYGSVCSIRSFGSETSSW